MISAQERSITTSWVETREFITGTTGVAPGQSKLGFKTRPADMSTTEAGGVLSSDETGCLGLEGMEMLPPIDADGRGELMLDVVEVDVIQVLMLGCSTPVGFNPT